MFRGEVKNCRKCGKLFGKPKNFSNPTWEKKIYCSKECFILKVSKGKNRIYKCTVCEIEFEHLRRSKPVKYCSKKCREHEKMVCCHNCKNFFLTSRPTLKKYCSHACSTSNKTLIQRLDYQINRMKNAKNAFEWKRATHIADNLAYQLAKQKGWWVDESMRLK